MTTLATRPDFRELGQSGRDLFELIFEHLPAIVFVKEAEHLRFVEVNAAAERVLGYSREELVGRSAHDFFPRHEADLFAAADRRVLAERRMIEIEAEVVESRNRGPRILRTKKLPLCDEQGVPRYLVGISEDITDRYNRERDLRIAWAAAEREDRERDRVLRQLRAIDEHRGLSIVYQPIVDLTSERLVGVEALARFDLTPPGPPDRWFDLAASVGLAVELELLAARRALAHLGDLASGMFLSINLSPDTLLSEELEALVGEHPAGRLVLELTEHSRVDDYQAVEARIARLRERGVRFAVDDAGAGWSSMQHVVRIHPDFIKLDIDLTRSIESSPQLRALATAIVAFAREVGSTVVAEGIETAAQLDTLRRLGVALGQGFLLGRPQQLPLSRTPVHAR